VKLLHRSSWRRKIRLLNSIHQSAKQRDLLPIALVVSCALATRRNCDSIMAQRRRANFQPTKAAASRKAPSIMQFERNAVLDSRDETTNKTAAPCFFGVRQVPTPIRK
jgi:hypothetical protein